MDLKRVSKKMSYLLRHHPEDAYLTMDENGWVSTRALLEYLIISHLAPDMSVIEEVVADNNKKRFEFSEDKTRIRAVQGHSVAIDLELEATEPPVMLFHGTARNFMHLIVRQGISRMGRNHVHLSDNQDTAREVGGRHGKPYVMCIFAKEMWNVGRPFYLSKNGVWLTDNVPVEFIHWPESDRLEFERKTHVLHS